MEKTISNLVLTNKPLKFRTINPSISHEPSLSSPFSNHILKLMQLLLVMSITWIVEIRPIQFDLYHRLNGRLNKYICNLRDTIDLEKFEQI